MGVDDIKHPISIAYGVLHDLENLIAFTVLSRWI